ncbi:MAG: tRNA pseudouridine(13) synthase TruD [Candidatus Bathyarchaeum tardum]|nr:MAG: tRNA pseudouridine(13) synthase TruD [Candidatus Bathyarchaeum tardum]
MQVPQIEHDLGMEVYATQSEGIGGKIKQLIDDFVVEELLTDGTLAEVNPPIEEWIPTGEGQNLICVLVKRRWDTFLAVREVADRMHINQKRVRFAGIKDTNALTGQHISIQNVTPNHVLGLQIRDITVYPRFFSHQRMYSELIKGNRFHITIREINQPVSVIEKTTTKVTKQIEKIGGVPNFFGHQRFGTTRPNTHLIGKYLTRNEPKKAALEFLATPSIHEHAEAREARQQLQDTMNFEEALEKFPRFLRYEHFMLRYLTKNPTDFIGAFRELPRRLRKLFVQAFQSYLFNRFLSERIRQGIPLDDPQMGDYAIWLDKNGLPTDKHEQVNKINIKLVTQFMKEDKMALAIPLVGPNQPPSKGMQGELEQVILEAEDVSRDCFKIALMPEATAEGKVRAVLNPVWNLVLEEIAEDKENEGKQTLKLAFNLNRGSYATVVLREFMKPQDVISSGY